MTPKLAQRPLALEPAAPSRWWAASGRRDWCTPDEELDRVRVVFGADGDCTPGVIDIDPCSNPWSRVGARRECMLERGENGLSVPWRGKTFSNPPYGVGEIEQFTARARTEAAAARRERRMLLVEETVYPTEIVLLVPANTETQWYHRDCAVADALCLRKGRIQFRPPPWIEGNAPWMAEARALAQQLRVDELRRVLDREGGWSSRDPEAEKNTSTVSNLYVYWGPRPERFVEVMGESGHAFITAAGERRR